MQVQDPFIGRVRELDLLTQALARAKDGAGQLVLVCGEPGVGKTRLCREASRRAARAGFTVAWGRGWPDGGAPPLWPWPPVLDALSDAAPELALDAYATPSERFARFAAINELLARACARSPVLAVLDDLHTADADALLLTRFVARSLERLPLVLLIAQRQGVDDERLQGLGDEGSTICLRHFDEEETRAFLLAHGQPDLSRQLLAAMHGLTQGNPLFLHRVSTGASAPVEGVRTAIGLAVKALAPGARTVLAHAALLGPSVTIAQAASVADLPAGHVLRGVEQGQDAGLVTADGKEQFSFTHQHVPAAPLAELLAEWAQAVLLCGRLSRARMLFDRALTAADAESDTRSFARAVIGLGGVWVNEHRSRVEWERITALQQRALDALPAEEPVLRCRLRVRLAAESSYHGGSIRSVLSALADVRAVGDDEALAEALSLCHHAMLVPQYARGRIALAEELITVAARAGHAMFALMGLCWRAVDLFLLGDPRAAQALAEFRHRADALDCRSVLYIADAMSVGQLIRAGRLAEAEQEATACYERGIQLGDADALGYLGAHLATIRWLQNRDAEMLATVAGIVDSPTLVPNEFAFRAVHAGLAARAGRPASARTLLDQLTLPGLAGLPESSTWLAGMAMIAETAWLLRDAEISWQVYELLAPYAALPVMPSLAVVCLGSAERPLGLAALTMGELDQAIAHLERAVAANQALGNRPLTAIAMADLAEALLDRGLDDDGARARDLLAGASATARSAEMPERAELWAARLEELSLSTGTIRHSGRHWLFEVDGRQALVADRIGVRHLIQLLANPGRSISALELTGSMTGEAGQQLLDDDARTAYRRQAEARQGELALAELDEDLARGEYLRDQIAALTEELEKSTGIGGRPRYFPDSGERARTAVRKAIKRAIDELTAAEPVIGERIRATVTTGSTCCYVEQDIRWSTPRQSAAETNG